MPKENKTTYTNEDVDAFIEDFVEHAEKKQIVAS